MADDPAFHTRHRGGDPEAARWLSQGSDPDPPRDAGNGPAGGSKTASSGAADPERNESHRGLRFWITALALAGLVLLLHRTFPEVSVGENLGEIVYGVLLILVVSSAVAFGKTGRNLAYLAAWAAIFLAVLVGYSYRHQLADVKDRVLAELIPDKGMRAGDATMRYPLSADGHFYIRALLDGTPVRFLVDTGATHIVLSPSDAERVGYDLDELAFDRYYETANGRVRGSRITIADFRIGGKRMADVAASVNGAPMRNSLLGMAFFERLEGYGVQDGMLTLRWGR